MLEGTLYTVSLLCAGNSTAGSLKRADRYWAWVGSIDHRLSTTAVSDAIALASRRQQITGLVGCGGMATGQVFRGNYRAVLSVPPTPGQLSPEQCAPELLQGVAPIDTQKACQPYGQRVCLLKDHVLLINVCSA